MFLVLHVANGCADFLHSSYSLPSSDLFNGYLFALCLAQANEGVAKLNFLFRQTCQGGNTAIFIRIVRSQRANGSLYLCGAQHAGAVGFKKSLVTHQHKGAVARLYILHRVEKAFEILENLVDVPHLSVAGTRLKDGAIGNHTHNEKNRYGRAESELHFPN